MSLRGVAVGAGYFSQFHYDAWRRIPDVDLVALCDVDANRAARVCTTFGVPRSYPNYEEMFDAERPDFVDVITPPAEHLPICRQASARGIHIICQKPLAPTFAEAVALVREMNNSSSRLMVHENFRFQPWHREIKKLADTGAVGKRLHSFAFRMRTGDGWGDDAYMDRQPYFREYARLLIYETGVHLIDTFRFLGGEIESVYARLRRLNGDIAGEDCGVVLFNFASGAVGILDANRYNESNCDNPRYTFGEFLVEGDGGSIRLQPDGTLTVQALGKFEVKHGYRHDDVGFAGDCCFATQAHFVKQLRSGMPFETNGEDYLRTLQVQEAVYASASRGQPVSIDAHVPASV